MLKEDAETRRQLADKEQSAANLEKLVEQYESDRDKYSTLLEQTHSDKQTISRALTQNNELKTQLGELQDAFVRVTQEKADLMNRLQAEEFKIKQLTMNMSLSATTTNMPSDESSMSAVQTAATKVFAAPTMTASTDSNDKSKNEGGELSADWADEGVETEKSEPAGSLSHGSSSLMDSIKVSRLISFQF